MWRAWSAFFFFKDTTTTEIYTLSLHDALPIWHGPRLGRRSGRQFQDLPGQDSRRRSEEHTSDSSHVEISYAVFCLKKKKTLGSLKVPDARSYCVNIITHVNTPN